MDARLSQGQSSELADRMEKTWQCMCWRWHLLFDNMQHVSTQAHGVCPPWLCLSAGLVTEKDPRERRIRAVAVH